MRVWLAALRETERFSAEKPQICEDHFLPEHITHAGISADAIPITPPLGGALLPAADDWTSPVEALDELMSPGAGEVEDVTANVDDDDEEEEEEEDEDDNYEEEKEDYDEEEEFEDSDDDDDVVLNMDDEAKKEWLAHMDDKPAKRQTYLRSELALKHITKGFVELLHSAPEGILDLNEATEKLGTHKRRVYDITSVLNGIKLVTKKSKNKIQWVGPTPVHNVKSTWKNKLTTDLLNLKTMEEALDYLIKDCAQQLFTVTENKGNANLAYVTYEDICRITALQDQTVIAVKAPEETKLEIPTPTEECIQIHLKASRGPIHVLTCETDEASSIMESDKPKSGCFHSVEESRIEIRPAGVPVTSSTVRSA